LSIKAGGLGINLENVDVAIFYEYWWTWVSYKQVLDRIIRLTSTNNKTVYNLLADPNVKLLGLGLDEREYRFANALIEKGLHSIDLWMSRKILEKRETLEDLLRGNEGVVSMLLRDLKEAYEKAQKQQ